MSDKPIIVDKALLDELDALAVEGERASPKPWVVHGEYVSSRHELVGRMSSVATADHIAAASPDVVRALVAGLRVAWEHEQQSEAALLVVLTKRCSMVGMCECCPALHDCPEAGDPHLVEGVSAVRGSEHLRTWAYREARARLEADRD